MTHSRCSAALTLIIQMSCSKKKCNSSSFSIEFREKSPLISTFKPLINNPTFMTTTTTTTKEKREI
jgi:hypothetical protein